MVVVAAAELSREERRDLVYQMIRDGVDRAEIHEQTGMPIPTIGKMAKSVQADALAPAPVALAIAEPAGGTAASPAKGATAETKAAAHDLGETWGDLWNLLAEAWDDPELALSEKEKAEWGQAAARSLELTGNLDKVKYVAPARVLGLTGKQAIPRLRKIAAKPMPRRGGTRAAEPAENPYQFQRPAGMIPRPEPVEQDIGVGRDKPIDLANGFGPAS